MKSAVKLFLAMALVSVTLVACGNSSTQATVSTTTVGQELEALDKAYKDGLLTEKEYEAQRKKVLNKK